MANRGEVIKGLEAVKETLADMRDRQGVTWVDDAITLLKAQEPRVIKNSAGNGICPGCGHIIPAWSSPNYCGYCGQAVKWNG